MTCQKAMDAAPAGEEVPPAPPLVDQQGRLLPGLRALERAPSSRAVCFACDRKIVKDDLRFEYRLRASKSLSDERRLHVGCAARLPAATRQVDLLRLQSMLAIPERPEDERQALAGALAALQQLQQAEGAGPAAAVDRV